MPKLEVDQLIKRFNDVPVLKAISFHALEGEFVVLLGPSGCGKTTTLRLIAGLLEPDDGIIRVDGEELAGPNWGIPPERRSMAMVFQNYAIWPHKTVFENVAYGLHIRRVPKDEVQRRVQNALRLVQLAEYEARYPAELSGGQQQRVALARAIVVEPSILLLDEPLSNLDAVLRENMRFELKELQRELGVTSIYVTHDQAEALVLADRLIVMRHGRIEQIGDPESVYLRPLTRFVAGFLGVTNLIDGTLQEIDTRYACVKTDTVGPIYAYLSDENRAEMQAGTPASVSVRPVNIQLTASPAEGSDCNTIRGRVTERTFLGELVEYRIAAGDQEWTARVHPSERFSVGDTVWLTFDYEVGTIVSER